MRWQNYLRPSVSVRSSWIQSEFACPSQPIFAAHGVGITAPTRTHGRNCPSPMRPRMRCCRPTPHPVLKDGCGLRRPSQQSELLIWFHAIGNFFEGESLMAQISDVGPIPERTKPTAGGQSASGRGLTIAASSDEKRVYVGNNAGVWRSDDRGVSFKHMVRPQPKKGSVSVPGALLCLN